MSSRRYDIVVVGAGIVGAACAWACAEAGLKVLVLERSGVAGETTAAGMGHLVVMDDSEAQIQLCSYSRTLWQTLAGADGSAFEYDPYGTLWVAADEEEMQVVESKCALYREHDIRSEVLDARALYEAEPHLRAGLAGGLRVPDDAVLYPPRATTFLLERARQGGAEWRTTVEVTAITDGGRVQLRDGTEIVADAVVNATGCALPALSPDLPIRKRKGHLAITEAYPHFVNHQLIELGYLKSAHSATADSVAFNVQPRRNGQLLIGSSRQFNAESPDVDAAILGRMLERAVAYMPGLAGLSVLRCWTGFRPTSPDNLPYIGPHPQLRRVWVAAGHEGLGIATSLATGQMIADMICGRETAIPAGPYLPSRLVAEGRQDV